MYPIDVFTPPPIIQIINARPILFTLTLIIQSLFKYSLSNSDNWGGGVNRLILFKYCSRLELLVSPAA